MPDTERERERESERRLWNVGKARYCNAETEAAAALASYARCVNAQWVKLDLQTEFPVKSLHSKRKFYKLNTENI